MEKRIFLLVIVSFLVFIVKGQIIDIPDTKLKFILVNIQCVDTNGDGNYDQNVDVNNDGEIDVSEALIVKNLRIPNGAVKNLKGIEEFKNLIKLNCNFNQITDLGQLDLPVLEELYCSGNNLTVLDASKMKNLKILKCYLNQLTTLVVSGLYKLEEIFCSNNKLSSLDVTDLYNLKGLYASDNNLSILDVSNLIFLTRLTCDRNHLTYINATGADNLFTLECGKNQLNVLLIKTKREYINFKFEDNPQLSYICCNDKLISTIKNLANSYGLTNCEINSYCSFNGGGEKYLLKGVNIYDENKNGCDDFDRKIPGVKFKITNGFDEGTFITNSTGIYSIFFREGSHTIIPVLQNPDLFELIPSSFHVYFSSTSDSVTQNICITPKELFGKINITVIPLSPPARPGFDAQYKIIWENKGNLLENGTIHFTYDENIFDYVNASQNPDAVNSGRLSWDYTDLLPFEKREITVTLNLNSPMENPPVNAGDITYLYANILDNVFRLENVIVGSYDPNDKTCLQGQYFHPDSVGKFVDFLIRFENTGNFAAENVVIKDIIDDKVFDVSSLLITDASHEMYTRIAGNKVEFIFENIQLPFEDYTNDGYVAFKIKTKSSLKLGDKMKNLADIYFDYNFPIRTNETQTTIAIPSGTKDVLEDVIIHPNPVLDILMLDSSSRWNKAEIFDISGRLIKVTGVDGFSVDVSGLQSGTYILHLSEKDKRGRVKFVKM